MDKMNEIEWDWKKFNEIEWNWIKLNEIDQLNFLKHAKGFIVGNISPKIGINVYF